MAAEKVDGTLGTAEVGYRALLQKKVPVVPFFHHNFTELGDTTYQDSINYVTVTALSM
jgi:hypothetical protein